MLKGFPIPKQRLDRKTVLPVSSAEWVLRLPVGRPDRALEMLYRLLRGSNRSRLSEGERRELLRQLDRPCRQAMQDMKSRVTLDVGLQEAAQVQGVDLIVRTGYELALAYRMLLEDGTLSRNRFGREKRKLAAVLCLALTHLSAALRASYRAHVKPAGQLWDAVLGLYLFAEHKGLVRVQPPKLAEASVEEIVKSLLLLRGSAPETLRSREQAALYRAIGQVCGLVELGQRHDSAGEAGFRYIGPDGSKILLRYPTLLNRLQAVRDQAHADSLVDLGQGVEIPGQAVGLLLNSLSRSQAKRGKRLSESLSMSGIVGLSDIYTVLCQDSAVGGAPGEGNPFRPRYRLVDARDLLPEELEQGLPEPDSDISDLSAGRAHARVRRGEFEVRNHSAGGLRLLIPRDRLPNIQVGEAVALQEARGGEWMLGSVRWLVRDKGHWHLGVGLFAPLVEPASVVGAASHRMPAVQRCLLLYRSGQRTVPERLLSSPGALRSGDSLVLLSAGRRIKVELGAYPVDVSQGAEAFPVLGWKAMDPITGDGKGNHGTGDKRQHMENHRSDQKRGRQHAIQLLTAAVSA